MNFTILSQLTVRLKTLIIWKDSGMIKNPTLIHFDPIWFILIHFDPFWFILIHLDPSWYILMHLDPSWCILNKLKMWWTQLSWPILGICNWKVAQEGGYLNCVKADQMNFTILSQWTVRCFVKIIYNGAHISWLKCIFSPFLSLCRRAWQPYRSRKLMSFASIYYTNPMTNPWKFLKNILRIGEVQELSFLSPPSWFFFQKKNFASSPWKFVKNYR